jgi:hypothetical protein
MRPAKRNRALHHVSIDGLTLVPLPVALSTALKKTLGLMWLLILLESIIKSEVCFIKSEVCYEV